MVTMNKEVCAMKDLCGGCLYQGVSYEDQVAQKDKEIRRLLKKHDISEDIYQGMVPAFTPYCYRNKMEYTFGDFEIGGELELGMHRKKSFMSIITNDSCQLVPDCFNQVLRSTLEFCRSRGYSFYHRKSHEGLLRNLVVRCGVKTNELLINIVTSSEDGFDESAYTQMILDQNWGDMTVVGIIRTFNDSVADAVIPEGTKLLYGRDYYNEEILGLKFKVQAFAFFQTNIQAVERLYSDALELIPDIDNKTVYDLYCGTGTISQLMASRAKEVYGIEIVEEAVTAAISNTELNGISNCHYICGDVKEKLSELTEKPDVIVVDPPRVGMHEQVVNDLSRYGIDEFLYISCNANTMCINIDQFRLNGYEPVYLKVYDNFPMTKHAECICRLKKTDKYEGLISLIEDSLENSNVIVAIDGANSDVTAAFLKNRYECNLYHMDDFMNNSQEFLDNVLLPTSKNRTARFNIYNHNTGKIRKFKIKEPTALTVVVGSGCMDNQLQSYYDLIIHTDDE